MVGGMSMAPPEVFAVFRAAAEAGAVGRRLGPARRPARPGLTDRSRPHPPTTRTDHAMNATGTTRIGLGLAPGRRARRPGRHRRGGHRRRRARLLVAVGDGPPARPARPAHAVPGVARRRAARRAAHRARPDRRADARRRRHRAGAARHQRARRPVVPAGAAGPVADRARPGQRRPTDGRPRPRLVGRRVRGRRRPPAPAGRAQRGDPRRARGHLGRRRRRAPRRAVPHRPVDRSCPSRCSVPDRRSCSPPTRRPASTGSPGAPTGGCRPGCRSTPSPRCSPSSATWPPATAAIPTRIELVVRANIKVTDGAARTPTGPPTGAPIEQVADDLEATRAAGAHEIIVDLQSTARTAGELLELAAAVTAPVLAPA